MFLWQLLARFHAKVDGSVVLGTLVRRLEIHPLSE